MDSNAPYKHARTVVRKSKGLRDFLASPVVRMRNKTQSIVDRNARQYTRDVIPLVESAQKDDMRAQLEHDTIQNLRSGMGREEAFMRAQNSPVQKEMQELMEVRSLDLKGEIPIHMMDKAKSHQRKYRVGGRALGAVIGGGTNELFMRKKLRELKELRANPRRTPAQDSRLKTLSTIIHRRRFGSTIGGAVAGGFAGEYIGNLTLDKKLGKFRATSLDANRREIEKGLGYKYEDEVD